jgi:hypothetical protein
MTRRAQAALEYLVTYGWAIVAILVVLGALTYFGFLNPSRYLPARCDFGAQLECVDYRLEELDGYNGCALLQLRNNFGDGIRIYDISVLDDNSEWGYGNAADCGGPAIPSGKYMQIAKGNISKIVSLNIGTDSELRLARGDRPSVQLRVTFSRDLGGAPQHELTGEIFSTVAPASG